MTGASVSTLSDVLRTFYLEDHMTVETAKVWMCPYHTFPQSPCGEYVCSAGDYCEWPADCPHAEYVLTQDSPPCCLAADWGYLLDDDGEMYATARKVTGIKGMLESPFLPAFTELLKRGEANE